MTENTKRPTRTKIAIACQGGGSQTAFTAGALSALLQHDVHRDFEIVTLSGTSGGAICATLVWYALCCEDTEPWSRLESFWEANTAQTAEEMVFNRTVIETLRAMNRGQLPTLEISPSDPFMQHLTRLATARLRPEFCDLGRLLDQHVDFGKIADWGRRASNPNLLMGAIDLLSGHLRVFNSRNDVICSEHVRASCAVPSIFPAVEVEGTAYWDGLFSDNPPIAETIMDQLVGRDGLPDEIWIIKINPTRIAEVPTAPEAVSTRRNQLIGNVSLFQQLHSIEWLNDLYAGEAFRPQYLDGLGINMPIRLPRSSESAPTRPWHIPFIDLSPALQEQLDYESKLDRDPETIGALMADGGAQALGFLVARKEIMGRDR